MNVRAGRLDSRPSSRYALCPALAQDAVKVESVSLQGGLRERERARVEDRLRSWVEERHASAPRLRRRSARRL